MMTVVVVAVVVEIRNKHLYTALNYVPDNILRAFYITHLHLVTILCGR